MELNVFNKISLAYNKGEKQIAVLIDPDKNDNHSLMAIIQKAESTKVDFLFYGGSLINKDLVDKNLTFINLIIYLPLIRFKI